MTSNRPHYLIAGSKSISESAARLQALLDLEYSGSADGDGEGMIWNPTLAAEDRPTPMASQLPASLAALPLGRQTEIANSGRRVQANTI
jgi:hypothetical protein